MEEVVPETKKIKKKWITEGTLKMIQEKRALKTRRDHPEQADKEYKQLCNKVKKATRMEGKMARQPMQGNRETLWRIYDTRSI